MLEGQCNINHLQWLTLFYAVMNFYPLTQVSWKWHILNSTALFSLDLKPATVVLTHACVPILAKLPYRVILVSQMVCCPWSSPG